MTQKYLSIPGHIPVKEAARRLHRSEKRVLQYIVEHRLPAHKVQGRYLIPVAAIETFHPHPHGRIRTLPVPWRQYRAGAQVRLLFLDLPVRTTDQGQLRTILNSCSQQQHHLFPGTMQRFICLDEAEPAQMNMILIWKTTDLPDETLLHLQLEQFHRDFATVLDWEQAIIRISESIVHT